LFNTLGVLSKFGTVLETVFAPRRDTRYDLAVDYIRETSQRTILVNRKVGELRDKIKSQAKKIAQSSKDLSLKSLHGTGVGITGSLFTSLI